MPAKTGLSHDTSHNSRWTLFRARRRIQFVVLFLVCFIIINYRFDLRSAIVLSHWQEDHSSPIIPSDEDIILSGRIDWSRFAYSQYATNRAYLCNAVMMFESLHRLGSRASRILFYDETWDLEVADGKDRDSSLLVTARDKYNVKLIPAKIGERAGQKLDTWSGSFAKFLAWNQTQYDRILHLDSDATLLRNLDHLFVVLPSSARVAMLRAYWHLPDQRHLTSMLILLTPSSTEYDRLMIAARLDNRREDEYDMEILNRLYGDSAMVLPHRKYGLLSGEFRNIEHAHYLGSDTEAWDPDAVLKETSIIHFSDWPLPKPWIMWPHTLVGEMMPKCRFKENGMLDNCRDKAVWMGLYDSFRKRRKDICALLSAPAPPWPPPNVTLHGSGH